MNAASLLSTPDLASPSLALWASTFLTAISGLLILVLFFGFFRTLMRPGCVGYITALGTLIFWSIWGIIANPGVIGSILPPPFNVIFCIGCGRYVVWVIISWLIRRGQPKTVLSVSSHTASIRMVPFCIFCRKSTTTVMNHTVQTEQKDGDEHSYFKAVYPFPAHSACYHLSLDKDAKRGWFLGMSILFSILALVAQILIFRAEKDPISTISFISSEQLVWLGVLLPLAISLLCCILFLIGVNTEDMIQHYCKKHIQK